MVRAGGAQDDERKNQLASQVIFRGAIEDVLKRSFDKIDCFNLKNITRFKR